MFPPAKPLRPFPSPCGWKGEGAQQSLSLHFSITVDHSQSTLLRAHIFYCETKAWEQSHVQGSCHAPAQSWEMELPSAKTQLRDISFWGSRPRKTPSVAVSFLVSTLTRVWHVNRCCWLPPHSSLEGLGRAPEMEWAAGAGLLGGPSHLRGCAAWLWKGELVSWCQESALESRMADFGVISVGNPGPTFQLQSCVRNPDMFGGRQ